MNNFAINNLANMEFMLYGGRSGANMNCPSMYNNYMGVNNFGLNTNYMYNPMFRGTNPSVSNTSVNGYNPSMNGYNPTALAADSIFTKPQAAATAAGTAAAAVGAAATNKDLDVLADYATKVNEGGETFLGALTGGVTFAAFENPQNVKHMWNAIVGAQKANKIFDLSKDGIKALWDNKETRELMQRAYSQTQAAYRRMGEKKIPLIQNWFAKPFTKADTQTVTEIIEKLEKEIGEGASANKELIAKYTEQLRASRGMDGHIPSAWNKIRNFFVGSDKYKNLSAAERIEQAEKAGKIAEGAKVLSTGAKFMKEFKGWFIFEAAIETLTKIIPTYAEGGADAGNKQVLQSGVKAAASAGGWALGRVAGGALGAKAGAAIGTCFGPGVGTAIGTVIGFACGCVGSWLAGKGVKALMGKDESEKLAEAKMKNTQEGQAQLIQLAYQKAQEGEAPKEVVSSLNNLFRQAS